MALDDADRRQHAEPIKMGEVVALAVHELLELFEDAALAFILLALGASFGLLCVRPRFHREMPATAAPARREQRPVLLRRACEK